jgi:hypothetical protein
VNFNALGLLPIELTQLESDITLEEVEAAIKELLVDRALGSDGFTGAFYKKTWHIIRAEVMVAVQAFSDGDFRGLEKLNNALIVLLPKKIGASYLGDFRPIIMIHSFAKLISKILALRLAPKLNELVDKNQNAFICLRTIQDNFKFVQRAAVLIRKKKILMLLVGNLTSSKKLKPKLWSKKDIKIF